LTEFAEETQPAESQHPPGQLITKENYVSVAGSTRELPHLTFFSPAKLASSNLLPRNLAL
jgi:hypothetical protein